MIGEILHQKIHGGNHQRDSTYADEIRDRPQALHVQASLAFFTESESIGIG